MTRNETDTDYAERLREIKEEFGGDRQKAHIKMDEVLCEALRDYDEDELVDEFEGYGKFYA